MELLDISRVPQMWIVCALCWWAFALLGYRYSYEEWIQNILYSVPGSVKYSSNTTITKCPLHYTNASWEKKPPPLKLPSFFWTGDILYYSDTGFQIGRLTMLIPAGVVSDIGFSRHVLIGSMVLMAVTNMVTYASKDEYYANIYVIGQMLEGVSYAFLWPSIYTLISRWSPPSKRYFFNALVFSGHIIGHYIIGDLMLFKYAFLRNKSWSEGIMISVALVLLWLPFGYIFIYHSPNKSPFINHRGPSITTNRDRRLSRPILSIRFRKIPCHKIFSSFPFICMILAYCSNDILLKSFMSSIDYGTYGMRLPETPEKIGSFFNGVAYLVPNMIAALFADRVVYQKLLSRTVVVKVLVSVGVFIPSVLQLAVLVIGCNVNLFWMIYTSTVYSSGFAIPIILCGTIELSPQNAGLLMGVVFTVRSLIKIVIKFIDTEITQFEFDSYLSQLRFKIIFYAGLSIAMSVPYIFFGSEEVQNWNRPSPVRNRRTIEKPL